MVKVGDFVKVRAGVVDPEMEKYDLCGWIGIVKKVQTFKGEYLVNIDWDIETLKNMPHEFIKASIEDGYGFCEMNLLESELVVLGNCTYDDDNERTELIHELENRHDDTIFDDDL